MDGRFSLPFPQAGSARHSHSLRCFLLLNKASRRSKRVSKSWETSALWFCSALWTACPTWSETFLTSWWRPCKSVWWVFKVYWMPWIEASVAWTCWPSEENQPENLSCWACISPSEVSIFSKRWRFEACCESRPSASSRALLNSSNFCCIAVSSSSLKQPVTSCKWLLPVLGCLGPI